jgi:hypothetical protein
VYTLAKLEEIKMKFLEYQKSITTNNPHSEYELYTLNNQYEYSPSVKTMHIVEPAQQVEL